jgi:hypothetical protein
MKKKLIVTGNARHGKDTFCESLEDVFGHTHISSSLFMKDFVFDKIGKFYGYQNSVECWEDRFNHRREWFDAIVDYNTPNLVRLAENIFNEYDVYSGIRNIDEFNLAKEKNLFQYSIWVDASKRLPIEPSSSLTISKEDCDFVFDNNEFIDKASKLNLRIYNFAKTSFIV